MSTDFELAVKTQAEKAVLKFIGDGGWLMPNYEARLKLPAEWMAQAWALVDRMVNHMAAELATDIKQILSVRERREALRALARDHFDSLMKLSDPS